MWTTKTQNGAYACRANRGADALGAVTKVSATGSSSKSGFVIVINPSFGGFTLSDDALEALGEAHGLSQVGRRADGIPRNSKALVSVVERLGDRASGDPRGRALEVVKVPPGRTYYVYEHDGFEWVAEAHKVFDASRSRWVNPDSSNNVHALRITVPPRASNDAERRVRTASQSVPRFARKSRKT